MHLIPPLVLHGITLLGLALQLAQPQPSTLLWHRHPPPLAPPQAWADVGCLSRVGFGLLWVGCSRAGRGGGNAGRPPGVRGQRALPRVPGAAHRQVPLWGRAVRHRFCKAPGAEGSRCVPAAPGPAPEPVQDAAAVQGGGRR